MDPIVISAFGVTGGCPPSVSTQYSVRVPWKVTLEASFGLIVHCP
jgi:hypothetical protein